MENTNDLTCVQVCIGTLVKERDEIKAELAKRPEMKDVEEFAYLISDLIADKIGDDMAIMHRLHQSTARCFTEIEFNKFKARFEEK